MKKRKDAIYIDTKVPIPKARTRRSRHIPVEGQPVEEYQYEKLLRCWYCGDINTTGRDEEDTGNSRMSSTYEMPRQVSQGSAGQTGEEAKSVQRSIFGYRVAPMAGADGTARPVKNVWTVTSHRGCKSCGTINWSGRY